MPIISTRMALLGCALVSSSLALANGEAGAVAPAVAPAATSAATPTATALTTVAAASAPAPVPAVKGSILSIGDNAADKASCVTVPASASAACNAAARPRKSKATGTGVASRTSPARSRSKLTVLQYLPLQQVTAVLGEIKMLPMPGRVSRVALGDGSIVSATTVDSNLLLIAEKVGETSLMAWSGGSVLSYKIQVVSKSLAVTRVKLDALIGETKGVAVRQVGNDLVLSGLMHKEAYEQFSKLVSDLPNVINNITLDQGTAFTRSVLFKLTFVEVKRSLLEQIGVSWSKDAQGPVLGLAGVAKKTGIYNPIDPPTSAGNLLDANPGFIRRSGTSGGVFFGLATTIASRLNLGINDGDARVLASPELTARSGGKAKLQVGGEVPIPLAGAFGATTVEFKPYGLLFSVEPQIDADNTITAKLSTELSQIDPAVSVQGIPGFITRNTSTELSIKPGEVVALSGLINSELSNAIDRVPALSRIPVFGRLFRSDDFRSKKTELVVFVEAEIIQAGDGLAKQLATRGQDMQRAFEDKLKAAKPTSLNDQQ